MMLKDLVLKNRSYRGFDESVRISRETLEGFVDCARLCPSSVNKQPLKYFLAWEPEEVEKVQGLTKWARALPEMVLPHPGKRPTDLHQRAMELLGAEVFEEDGTIRAKADHPKGAVLCFPKKSVGATENAVLFAVGAEGATRLEHCAREPEVVHLCRFLKAMGAEITGEGTEQITVYGRRGKRLLSGCRYRVPGDRIAAGTYLLMGAATRGHLTLSGAPLDEMGAVLSLYQKIGGQYTRKSGTLVADSKNVQHAVPYVETEEYPGFPTDLQSLYLAAAMTLEGKSCICENVFEDRLRTAEELQKMGGTLQICGKWLTAEKSRLHGAEVVSQDLRGGAALVSAALAAEGFSTIRQTELIERGYERFPETLRELGAKIIVEKEI